MSVRPAREVNVPGCIYADAGHTMIGRWSRKVFFVTDLEKETAIHVITPSTRLRRFLALDSCPMNI